MKKISLWTIIIVLCVSLLGVYALAGCATEAAAPAETEAPAATEAPAEAPAATEAPAEAPAEEPMDEFADIAGKHIGFVNAGPDDYYAQFGDALVAVAEMQGMRVTELNSDYSPSIELANVQDLIAAGVDAIAVITAGAAGSAATIEAANEAGVPIFFIAGKPELLPGTDLTGHVTDNFVIMGYQVGQWVAENYPDAKSVKIPGFLGQGPAEGEIVGYQMAMEENGMEPAFLTASSEWQRTLAIPITEDLLASGRDFDVLFACNEETAAGVITVFEEQGIAPGEKIIVSANGKEDGWEFIRQGWMQATSPNPPSLNADLCVQQIIRHFRGEPFEQYLQIKPWDVLTIDNLDQAIPWNVPNYLAGRAAGEFEYTLEYYEQNYLENKADFERFDAALEAYLAAN
jgi:ribose transport system substrate-binding protein